EGRTVDLLVELNRQLIAELNYIIREEPGIWTPEQTLKEGKGSCRDLATLLMILLRERGIAARFASGYLIQLTDEGMLPDEPKGVSADVADLHAWVEVFLPGAGWIGLDATSGLMAGEGHIPLCSTAIPSAAAPIDGTTSVLAKDVDFQLEVRRLGHEARPTAPYEEDVWSAARSASRKADTALTSAGIRLTCGGEPTFNSRLHPNEPEWNGEALGATKWQQGVELSSELRKRLAPGAAVLRRQGKLYPGESLPRWALELIYRRDGEPVWPDRSDLTKSASVDDAEALMQTLAEELKIPEGILPAYEDPWRVLQDEAALPADVDPHSVDLDSTEERRRLARVLDRGVKTVAGFGLPVARSNNEWVTAHYEFRRGRMYLIPGDSPMGLRLPLNSLSPKFKYAGEVSDLRYPGPQDPRLQPDPYATDEEETAPPVPAADPRFMRTVLCVEPRDGELFVFIPPMTRAEDFLELVSAIDRARLRTKLEVMLEGYPPPSDHALERFAVTPDPGVLEVNIPVCTDGAEYEELIHEVFDAALHVGLHSEKYMVDGRQAGSGGGNHLTLGGPSALESPFVNRGDLLASLLTFIQHHPSLSYMFNGLFVGPTSQSPRVDEARHESLYELEIALERGFSGDSAWAPWENDRLYRHLLTDLTGNTHRAEVCIDKLFDYGTAAGKQGVLELRAFEMPPHPRMVCAQMFLARALVASFAKTPYKRPLVRWGTRLHDQFLLPTWMWRDFQDVLSHLRAADIDFPDDTYRPFVELRCPTIGRFEENGVAVELRNAIEPWNVLGEELTTTGTARYVDSSVERIEVRAEGIVPERHILTVNGQALPMHGTGTAGEAVGGVRFRAWAPPHSLHAHLGIHHPLRIDLFDTWAGRAVAAGAYHVWHPEGRAFDEPPLTRFEAAARRGQRFERIGPLPYDETVHRARRHPDGPFTLDLRRLEIDRPMPPPKEFEPYESQRFAQSGW
ncbi:MAG: transglutaminase family protein, partial [Myxococcota bacterium]